MIVVYFRVQPFCQNLHRRFMYIQINDEPHGISRLTADPSWFGLWARFIIDSGCLYRDCFMYLQPRISFQPRVVLNREQGIFGMWGDKKIVTTWWIIICFHRYLCPVCSRRWWMFLQINHKSFLIYLKIIWNCWRKFQPRLTVLRNTESVPIRRISCQPRR